MLKHVKLRFHRSSQSQIYHQLNQLAVLPVLRRFFSYGSYNCSVKGRAFQKPFKARRLSSPSTSASEAQRMEANLSWVVLFRGFVATHCFAHRPDLNPGMSACANIQKTQNHTTYYTTINRVTGPHTLIKIYAQKFWWPPKGIAGSLTGSIRFSLALWTSNWLTCKRRYEISSAWHSHLA